MTRYQWPPTPEQAEAIAKRLGRLHRETVEETDARNIALVREQLRKMDDAQKRAKERNKL